MAANNNTFDLIVIALVLGTMLAVFVGLLWLRKVYGGKTWHKSYGGQKLAEPRHKALCIQNVWQLHQS